MNNKSLILILFFLPSLSFKVSSQVTFQRTYGGGNDYGQVIKQTDDGFIVSGYTSSFGAGGQDVYLVKTDSFGNLIWNKTYGGSGNDFANDIDITSDGGFIITGATDFGSGGKDIYLIKTNASGLMQWSRTFGRNNDDYGASIEETLDSGFIIGGNISGTNGGGCLIKTNSFGDTLWTIVFNVTPIKSVKQTFDRGYIVTGGIDNIFLIKIDSLGNIMWSKNFGGLQEEDGLCVQQTLDSGYIIAGTTFSFGAGNSDIYLIKTDKYGNFIWSKTYGEGMFDRGYFVQEIIGGGFILTGWTQTNLTGSAGHICLIKTDINGDTVWVKAFYDGPDYYSYYVQQTKDGGFITAGHHNGNGIYVLKTNNSGNSSCNEYSTLFVITSPLTQVNNFALSVNSGGTLITAPTMIGSGGNSTLICVSLGIDDYNLKNSSLIIFPNPSINILHISLNKNIDGLLNIYNLTGEKVYSEHFNGAEKIINFNFKQGIYLVQVSDGNDRWIQKVTKE